MCASGKGWAVIIHPENRLENLERRGFGSYCPRISKRIRHARRAVDVERPLFTGYLFARVNLRHWRPILLTLGVRSIVRLGQEPGLVDALKAREHEGVIVGTRSQLQLGQQVRIDGGPFDGLIATIVNLSDADRIVVLMTLLNRQVKVHVMNSGVLACDAAGASAVTAGGKGQGRQG
jgi:transcriptional antiterminator RfaH